MLFVFLAHGVIRLDELVVSARRDSVVLVEDSVRSFDLRQDLLLQPSSMFRELGNRFVFSIRGLEDKQNILYLEGITFDNPVWGYALTSLLYPSLLSRFSIHPSDYSTSVSLNRKPFLSMEAGMYGRVGVALSGGVWGMGLLSDENAYPYEDPFGRQYIRRNNYQRLFNGYYMGDGVLLFSYWSLMGMPLRGYGDEGSDREVQGGVLMRMGRVRGSIHYYRYNEESPDVSYRLSAARKFFIFGVEGWGRKARIATELMGEIGGWRVRGGFSTSMEGRIQPLYHISRVWSREHLFAELLLKNRLPSFSELYFEGAMARGNPGLSSEHFASLEAGWSGGVDEWWVRGDAFATAVMQPIFWMPSDSVWMPLNGEYLLLWGVEVMARSRYAGFTFSWLRNRLNGTEVLPYRPEVISSIYFLLPLGDFTLRVEGTYYGSRPTYFSPLSQQLPPILLLNMHLMFNLDYGTVFVHLNNLLNRNWEFISGYPTEPFSVVVGFRREWR